MSRERTRSSSSIPESSSEVRYRKPYSVFSSDSMDLSQLATSGVGVWSERKVKCSLAYPTVEYTGCEVSTILFYTIRIESFCNTCLFTRSPIHTFNLKCPCNLKRRSEVQISARTRISVPRMTWKSWVMSQRRLKPYWFYEWVSCRSAWCPLPPPLRTRRFPRMSCIPSFIL